MSIKASISRRLAALFFRNGHVRRQNPTRMAQENRQRYKKGDELRLTANSKDELALIQRLLLKAGFQPGRPFTKDRRFLLPIYGRQKVERFLKMIDKKIK